MADYNCKLKQLMLRCSEKNIKLNKDKIKLRLEEVKYMGHVLTKDGLKVDPEKSRAINEMPAPTNVQ